MAGTDKTKPPWVKIVNREVPVIEHHDHRDGICDLPPAPTKENILRAGGHCCWAWSWDGVNWYCGCGMCVQQDERKAKARRERRGARRAIAEQLAD